MTLSSTESKQLIGRYLQALSGQPKTPELVTRFVEDPGLAEHIYQAEAAFPAYELIADDLVAERDRVALRGRFCGFHRGPFAGIEATGRSVSAPVMIFYRLEGDRIVEHWLQFDASAIVAQLTAPTAATA